MRRESDSSGNPRNVEPPAHHALFGDSGKFDRLLLDPLESLAELVDDFGGIDRLPANNRGQVASWSWRTAYGRREWSVIDLEAYA